MGILSWIVLGLIVGVLAKWLMPGDDPGGIFLTIVPEIVVCPRKTPTQNQRAKASRATSVHRDRSC